MQGWRLEEKEMLDDDGWSCVREPVMLTRPVNPFAARLPPYYARRPSLAAVVLPARTVISLSLSLPLLVTAAAGASSDRSGSCSRSILSRCLTVTNSKDCIYRGAARKQEKASRLSLFLALQPSLSFTLSRRYSLRSPSLTFLSFRSLMGLDSTFFSEAVTATRHDSPAPSPLPFSVSCLMAATASEKLS